MTCGLMYPGRFYEYVIRNHEAHRGRSCSNALSVDFGEMLLVEGDAGDFGEQHQPHRNHTL